MPLTKDEFWKRVTNRVRDNLPEETRANLNAIELKRLSQPLLRQILQAGVEALVEELRATKKESFLEWIEKERANLQQQLEQTGYWYLGYVTKLGISGQDLAALMELATILGSVDMNEEIYWDPDVAPKLLMLNGITYGNALLPWIRFRPILDFESFLRTHLGLDINWMKATCALTAEELLVRKALKELDIEHEKIWDFEELRKLLVGKIKEEGKRTGLKVLTIPARRSIRNMVIHKGYNLTETEAHEIMGDIIQLANDLSTIRNSGTETP